MTEQDKSLIEKYDSSQNFINPTVRLRLRKDVEVALTGMPIQLTQKEAKKIQKILEAFIEERGEKMKEKIND